MTTTVYKQLVTKQDLAVGTGQVNQIRGGQTVLLDLIDFSTIPEGIEKWIALLTYPKDAYTKGSDGEIYKAKLEQSGNNPVTDSEINWVKLIQPVKGVILAAGALLDGSTLSNNTPVFFNARKPKFVALNRHDADVMSDDFTNMEGFAKYAGVTGGQGQTIYWVTKDSDSTIDYSEGTLRWAIEQVRVAGSGRILFDPYNEINITIGFTQILIPTNCTIDAPGRNVNIYTDRDITHFKLDTLNSIVRRLKFRSLPLALPATTRDGIFIEPTTADKFWIDECDFTQCADGCIDIASLLDVTIPCRGTISRNLFRNHDKVMLIGSLVCYNAGSPAFCPTALDEIPTILVTVYKNWFDHTGQRHPKVVTKAFVHSVNNYFHISAKDRDDGTTGANYGILTATGGSVLSEGDLFTSANGSNQEAVNSVAVPWIEGADGIGAAKITNTVVTDAMTLTELNAADVPVPPYLLVPETVVDTVEGRLNFAESIIEIAGASIDSTIDGKYIWNSLETRNPDGETVYSTLNTVAGRFIAKAKKTLVISTPIEDVVDSSAILIPRVSTVFIVSGLITLDPLAAYAAVDTEGAAATDDITDIAGLTEDGIYYLRAASSGRTLVFKNGVGNVFTNTGLDIELTTSTLFVTALYDKTAGRLFISL